MYKAASFFTGIGGIDLAFAWSGFDIVFQCEIDAYCQQVLKKHAPAYWPNAKLRGDIKNVTKTTVGKVDVMFGGFPCQDISIAGKRAGVTTGTRSGLWFELLRLIGDIRPRVILLENVGNIANVGGTIVTATLAEIGYDALWFTLRAADVGAPHQRERWFCVAYRSQQRYSKPATAKRRAYNRKRNTQSRQRIQVTSTVKPSRKALSKLAYSDSKRRSSRGNHRGKRYLQTNQERNTQTAQPKRERQFTKSRSLGQVGRVGNPQRQRLEGRPRQELQSKSSAKRCKRSGRNERASIKPRLGRAAHGVSSWMDRHNGQWPARPDEPQFDYEPPRVTGRRENRVNRVKALGNAVVPQVVYPLAQAIKMFLDSQ